MDSPEEETLRWETQMISFFFYMYIYFFFNASVGEDEEGVGDPLT